MISYGGFFISYRQIFSPSLHSHPIIILSGGSNYVVTHDGRTGTLKLGVNSPFFRIRQFLRSRRITIFDDGCTLCNSVSHHIVALLARLAPNVARCDVSRYFISLSNVSRLRTFTAALIGAVCGNANVPIAINVTTAGALTGITDECNGGCPNCRDIYVVSDRRGHIGTLRNFPVDSI